jgi:hypothetical protein
MTLIEIEPALHEKLPQRVSQITIEIEGRMRHLRHNKHLVPLIA